MTAAAPDRARSVDGPNPALAAIIASADPTVYAVVRVMPPDGVQVRLADGTSWILFSHRSAGLP